MANEQFKLGEEVRMKSGGVKMTVNSITPEGDIEVVYMDGKQAKYEFFKPHVLESVQTQNGFISIPRR